MALDVSRETSGLLNRQNLYLWSMRARLCFVFPVYSSFSWAYNRLDQLVNYARSTSLIANRKIRPNSRKIVYIFTIEHDERMKLLKNLQLLLVYNTFITLLTRNVDYLLLLPMLYRMCHSCRSRHEWGLGSVRNQMYVCVGIEEKKYSSLFNLETPEINWIRPLPFDSCSFVHIKLDNSK